MISLRELELTAGQNVVEALDGATIAFTTQPNPITVPCTITKILTDFVLVFGGKSSKTVVEICLFRAALLGDRILSKGDFCTLTPYTGGPQYKLRLWHGGLMPGGKLYQFMLVDANYNG